jgi:hypothetical protein
VGLVRKDKKRFADQAYVDELFRRLYESFRIVGDVLAGADDAELDKTSPVGGLEKQLLAVRGGARSPKFRIAITRLEWYYDNINDWLACVGEPTLDDRWS